MLRRPEMFSGVAVRRIVAAADVPAGSALPECYPDRPEGDAFFARPRRSRRREVRKGHSFQMLTRCRHLFFLAARVFLALARDRNG